MLATYNINGIIIIQNALFILILDNGIKYIYKFIDICIKYIYIYNVTK